MSQSWEKKKKSRAKRESGEGYKEVEEKTIFGKINNGGGKMNNERGKRHNWREKKEMMEVEGGRRD